MFEKEKVRRRLVAILTCQSLVTPGFFGGPNTNQTISQLVPSTVSLRITETEQLCQAKRTIGGIGHMLFSTDSQKLESGKDPKASFGEPLKHVIILCGQILVSQN